MSKPKRSWVRFDRACWMPKPHFPSGPYVSEYWEKLKVSNIIALKSRYFKRQLLRRIQLLSMIKKMNVSKFAGRVNVQKVRTNTKPSGKIRKNAKKPSIRATKEYRIWRASVLNKFNHTCSFCGAKERLELDHIEPVSKRPDLIMTDDNARVLCKPCHKTTDSYPKSLR